MFKFRTCNHHFPIETSRWNGTQYPDNICRLCNSGLIGSEQHYLLKCSFFDIERENLSNLTNISDNVYCFARLLSTHNMRVLKPLCIFIKSIIKKV